jgi:hypothetical protein
VELVLLRIRYPLGAVAGAVNEPAMEVEDVVPKDKEDG